MEGLRQIPDSQFAMTFIIPGPGTFRHVEPTGVSEQGLQHCSYLKTPGKNEFGLNSSREEGNIPQDQRKLYICLGLNFQA